MTLPPPLSPEEKVHDVKEKLEWLQLIPRLKRINIPLLAKVLDMDVGAIRDVLPPLTRDFGVHIDRDYLRLPETIPDLIHALQQAFDAWYKGSELRQGKGEDLPRVIDAWLAILGEILRGSTLFKREWILAVLNITESAFPETMREWGTKYGFEVTNDIISMNLPELPAESADTNGSMESSRAEAAERNFMDELDQELQSGNIHEKKEESNENEVDGT